MAPMTHALALALIFSCLRSSSSAMGRRAASLAPCVLKALRDHAASSRKACEDTHTAEGKGGGLLSPVPPPPPPDPELPAFAPAPPPPPAPPPAAPAALHNGHGRPLASGLSSSLSVRRQHFMHRAWLLLHPSCRKAQSPGVQSHTVHRGAPAACAPAPPRRVSGAAGRWGCQGASLMAYSTAGAATGGCSKGAWHAPGSGAQARRRSRITPAVAGRAPAALRGAQQS